MPIIENAVVVPAVEAASRSISRFVVDVERSIIEVNWRWYDADNNKLEQIKTVIKTGQEFNAIAQEHCLANELIFDAIKRILYLHASN